MDKRGQGPAIRWTRLSSPVVRRQCRCVSNSIALADNLGNFLRTLATPEPIKDWSLPSLRRADV